MSRDKLRLRADGAPCVPRSRSGRRRQSVRGADVMAVSRCQPRLAAPHPDGGAVGIMVTRAAPRGGAPRRPRPKAGPASRPLPQAGGGPWPRQVAAGAGAGPQAGPLGTHEAAIRAAGRPGDPPGTWGRWGGDAPAGASSGVRARCAQCPHPPGVSGGGGLHHSQPAGADVPTALMFSLLTTNGLGLTKRPWTGSLARSSRSGMRSVWVPEHINARWVRASLSSPAWWQPEPSPSCSG